MHDDDLPPHASEALLESAPTLRGKLLKSVLMLLFLVALLWPHEWINERRDLKRTLHTYIEGSGVERVVALQILRRDFDPHQYENEVLERAQGPALGAFHELLASTGDRAYLDAVLAFVIHGHQVSSSSTARRLEESLASILELDRAGTCEALRDLWSAPLEREVERGPTRDLIATSLLLRCDREELREWVMSLPDNVDRGRFHPVLARTGDASHSKTILASIATRSRKLSGRYEPESHYRDEVTSLLKLGGQPRDLFLEGMRGQNPIVAGVSTEVLKTFDLDEALRIAEERLELFIDGYPATVLALRESGFEPSHPYAEVPWLDMTWNKAQKLIASAERDARRLIAILTSLRLVPDHREVDFLLIRGTSSPLRELVEFCTVALEERLEAASLVDTLFRYLVSRGELAGGEVDAYEVLLRRQGEICADEILRNLERLLAEAQGRPDDIPWPCKKIGFTLLSEVGRRRHVPALERFLPDATSYPIAEGPKAGESVRFREACQAAIRAASSRAE